MYCPNCGAQNKKKQNFCRYCGLHLEDIEKTFVSQLVFGDDTKRLKQLRRVRKATDFAQFLSFVIVLVGVVSLIVFDHRSGKFLMTVGLLSFFLAQSVRSINGYLQRQAPRRRVTDASDETMPINGTDTSKLIEDRPFAPVTEPTTARLVFDERKND